LLNKLRHFVPLNKITESRAVVWNEMNFVIIRIYAVRFFCPKFLSKCKEMNTKFIGPIVKISWESIGFEPYVEGRWKMHQEYNSERAHFQQELIKLVSTKNIDLNCKLTVGKEQGSSYRTHRNSMLTMLQSKYMLPNLEI